MSSDKIRKNLLLDSETIKILEEYSKNKDGSKNISSAIRSMSREWKEEKHVLETDKYRKNYDNIEIYDFRPKCCNQPMNETGIESIYYPIQYKYKCSKCGNEKYVKREEINISYNSHGV